MKKLILNTTNRWQNCNLIRTQSDVRKVTVTRSLTLPVLTFALCLLSFQIISAQETPQPNPKTAPNPKIVIAPLPRPKSTPPKYSESKKIIVNESGTPAEKSIAVAPKINITLCVKEGTVKINGWERDEIRAFVQEGSQVGFKIAQKNLKSGQPEWVYVVGFEPSKTQEIKPEECLSGSEIELDVPRGATVNLKSLESEINIESVAKVWVANLTGDITLNDIANGIEATTSSGDLMVEKSSGRMILNNTEGNITAFEVSPSEIGDIFKAKTNSGRISLQSVEHRQIETSSISGSTAFDGAILDGGQYNFSTTNGSIVLSVPPSSLCKINAWFGFGAFASEIMLQNALKKEQSLSAQLGNTDATCNMNLKTGSGVIKIKVRKSVSKDVEKSIKSSNTKKNVNLNQKQRCALQAQNQSRITISKKRQ
jgi:hypothetical protein